MKTRYTHIHTRSILAFQADGRKRFNRCGCKGRTLERSVLGVPKKVAFHVVAIYVPSKYLPLPSICDVYSFGSLRMDGGTRPVVSHKEVQTFTRCFHIKSCVQN